MPPEITENDWVAIAVYVESSARLVHGCSRDRSPRELQDKGALRFDVIDAAVFQTTYQAADTPADFVSVISHENESAMERHKRTDETKAFSDNLYKHVTDDERIEVTCVASSEA